MTGTRARGPCRDGRGRPRRALLSVAKGDPTPEELAALTAVVLSLGSGEADAPEKPSARHWIRRQQLQLAPKPGPGVVEAQPGLSKKFSNPFITAAARLVSFG